MNNLTAEIPGLAAAIQRECEVRDESFLNLPRIIAGVEALPITPRMLLLLHVSNSPFVCGGVPLPEHVAAFLWITSPRFIVGNGYKARWRRWQLCRAIRRASYQDAVTAIRAHVEDAFQDSPSESSGEEKQPVVSVTASLVDCFASQYGWPEREVLDTPIARLFQYARMIRQRNNPDAIIVNKRSAKITGDWLAQINADRSRPVTVNN